MGMVGCELWGGQGGGLAGEGDAAEVVGEVFEFEVKDTIVFAVVTGFRATPRVTKLDDLFSIFFANTHDGIGVPRIDANASITFGFGSVFSVGGGGHGQALFLCGLHGFEDSVHRVFIEWAVICIDAEEGAEDISAAAAISDLVVAIAFVGGVGFFKDGIPHLHLFFAAGVAAGTVEGGSIGAGVEVAIDGNGFLAGGSREGGFFEGDAVGAVGVFFDHVFEDIGVWDGDSGDSGGEVAISELALFDVIGVDAIDEERAGEASFSDGGCSIRVDVAFFPRLRIGEIDGSGSAFDFGGASDLAEVDVVGAVADGDGEVIASLAFEFDIGGELSFSVEAEVKTLACALIGKAELCVGFGDHAVADMDEIQGAIGFGFDAKGFGVDLGITGVAFAETGGLEADPIADIAVAAACTNAEVVAFLNVIERAVETTPLIDFDLHLVAVGGGFGIGGDVDDFEGFAGFGEGLEGGTKGIGDGDGAVVACLEGSATDEGFGEVFRFGRPLDLVATEEGFDVSAFFVGEASFGEVELFLSGDTGAGESLKE